MNTGCKTAAQYLDEGKKFLAAKEYDNALNSYSEAIALEPDNYMSFFQVSLIGLKLLPANNYPLSGLITEE